MALPATSPYVTPEYLDYRLKQITDRLASLELQISGGYPYGDADPTFTPGIADRLATLEDKVGNQDAYTQRRIDGLQDAMNRIRLPDSRWEGPVTPGGQSQTYYSTDSGSSPRVQQAIRPAPERTVIGLLEAIYSLLLTQTVRKEGQDD